MTIKKNRYPFLFGDILVNWASHVYKYMYISIGLINMLLYLVNKSDDYRYWYIDCWIRLTSYCNCTNFACSQDTSPCFCRLVWIVVWPALTFYTNCYVISCPNLKQSNYNRTNCYNEEKWEVIQRIIQLR